MFKGFMNHESNENLAFLAMGSTVVSVVRMYLFSKILGGAQFGLLILSNLIKDSGLKYFVAVVAIVGIISVIVYQVIQRRTAAPARANRREKIHFR